MDGPTHPSPHGLLKKYICLIGFVYEDLVIEGYQHHPTITLPFAV
jgi:thymidylate synthase